MKTFQQFLDEALASFLVRAAARSLLRNKGLIRQVAKSTVKNKGLIRQVAKSTVKNKGLTQQVAKSIVKPAATMTAKAGSVARTITKPRAITGFQTARGSKYTYVKKPGSLPQTQRTAAQDPYHPTAPGVKQKSDYTIFTTPQDSMTMRRRFISGSRETRDTTFKGLPMETKPELGKAPVEYWKKYAETGGREVIHPGSRITDIQTATPGSGVGLYGAQRKELADRLKKAFKNPQAIPILKKDLGIKPKPKLKVTKVPSVASSNPYRNLGVGRRESVKEGKNFAQFMLEGGGFPKRT